MYESLNAFFEELLNDFTLSEILEHCNISEAEVLEELFNNGVILKKDLEFTRRG